MYEQIRAFERKCLRVCLKMYRSVHIDYQHYVSNKLIYKQANVPRIDSFAIKLTRDYLSNLPRIGNKVIDSISSQSAVESEQQTRTGYLTPQAFRYCNDKGLIQNAENIPILYHWKRNKANKRISMLNTDFVNYPEKFSGSTSIPQRDLNDFHRLKFNKYDWINAHSVHIRELQTDKLAAYVCEDSQRVKTDASPVA